jgi:hypothetical protein
MMFLSKIGYRWFLGHWNLFISPSWQENKQQTLLKKWENVADKNLGFESGKTATRKSLSKMSKN